MVQLDITNEYRNFHLLKKELLPRIAEKYELAEELKQKARISAIEAFTITSAMTRLVGPRAMREMKAAEAASAARTAFKYLTEALEMETEAADLEKELQNAREAHEQTVDQLFAHEDFLDSDEVEELQREIRGWGILLMNKWNPNI